METPVRVNEVKRVRFDDDDECIQKEIKIIPEFQMKTAEDSLEKGLNENGCFCVFKVCKLLTKSVNIRALIFVKKTCMVAKKPFKEDDQGIHGKLKHPLKTLRECMKISKQSRRSRSDSELLIAPVGIASLVWSVDDWNTWESLEAVYSEQTKDYLLYEVTLNNVQNHIEDGQKIDMACFYQNQNGLFGDTNNDQSYTFRRMDFYKQTDQADV